MIEPFLKLQLEPAVRRRRSCLLWKSLAVCWGLGGAAGGFLLLVSLGTGWPMPWAVPLLALLAVVGALGIVIRAALWHPDYQQVARGIEQKHPELHALLLTAVEQRPDPKTGRFSYLQKCVIQDAIHQGRLQPWAQSVSGRRLAALAGMQGVALAGLLLVLMAFPSAPGRPRLAALDRARLVEVSPGDAVVEKGQGLVVLARFNGQPPAEAELVVEEGDQPAHRCALARSLDDPVFGGSIAEVTRDLAYHVSYAGQRTRSFQVTVFEYPRLEHADATLRFPEYTGLAAKEIQDTRRVSAVEGTRLDFDFHLNKPVASARLVSRQDKTALALTVGTNQPAARLDALPLEKSRIYELELVDHDGRTNKIPAQFVLDVLPNQRPELKLIAPKGDQRVSALEEVLFRAETSDDFGVLNYGLHYAVPGGQSHDVILGSNLAAQEKKTFEHLLSLEILRLQVDRLLSWHVWADDLGPDGKTRRSYSDMFFAEVRPFEEIFREGQSQEDAGAEADAGQQGAGNETRNLAELQKQIINATWRFIRQETGTQPSEGYRTNIVVVRDSQEQALTQAQSLKERAASGESLQTLQSIEQEMQTALERLTQAADTAQPLPDALTAEQAAYQALLQLSAREFLVSQSRNRQGRGGGGGGGQRDRQQLDQLELKQAQNRYETERQASPLQSPEQQEQRQVLNRLKELAQRQQDLNDRLQELQTALHQAQTEAEREEILRRLKRLREEEREILADVDELDQRMNRPENQSRMAEARQQLDQSRSRVQQASEALDQEAVSQALAAGTRAQRQLEDLREDFRKQNASQFTDEMRHMRQDARDLAQNQEAIREQLDTIKQQRRNSLTDTSPTNTLPSQLQQQQQTVTNLLGHMREISDQAESAEPLLARQLYDAFRRTSQGNLQQVLNLTEELVQRKFPEEAAPFEQRARQEINTLKSDIEKAAESVLGDESEALRLARQELERLADQVEKEMQLATAQSGQNQNTPDSSNASPDSNSSSQTNLNRRLADAAQPDSPSARETNNDPTGSRPGGQRQADASPPDNQAGSRAQAGENSPGQPGSAQAQNDARPDLGRERGENFFDSGFGSGPNRWEGPLTGPEFLNWSDRLRNVEEIVELPDLRSEVARVRDRARAMRAEFKRHGKEPQWDLVQTQIVSPLRAVQTRVNEELARRQPTDFLVPIDRDPVPARYSELVRRYYEKLGSE
jgi:hypothetical protein